MTRDRLCVAAILLLGLVLRFLFLAEHSYWLDEIYSIDFSHGDWPGLIRATANDVHPPLYYVMLSAWMSWFGESEIATRSLSAVFGALCVAVVFRIGATFYHPRVGMVAAFLMAIASYAIYFSQEARMYTLLVFLGALSTYFLWQACKRPTASALITYTLAAVLLVYTHNYGLFMLAAHAAYVVSLAVVDKHWRRKNFTRWMIAAAAVVGLYLPWMLILTNQIERLDAEGLWISAPTLYTIAGSFSEYAGNDAVLRAAAAMLVLLALVPLLSTIVVALRRKHLVAVFQTDTLAATYLLALCLFVPIAAGFAISRVSMPIYHTRYTFVGYFAFWLLIARGISLIPHKWARSAAFVLLIVFGAKVLAKEGYVHRDRAGFREASQYLSDHVHRNDLILLCGSDHLEWPIEYYIQKRSAVAPIYEIDDRVNEEDEARMGADKKNIWLVRLEKAEEPCRQVPGRLKERFGDATAVMTTAREIEISVYVGHYARVAHATSHSAENVNEAPRQARSLRDR